MIFDALLLLFKLKFPTVIGQFSSVIESVEFDCFSISGPAYLFGPAYFAAPDGFLQTIELLQASSFIEPSFLDFKIVKLKLFLNFFESPFPKCDCLLL